MQLYATIKKTSKYAYQNDTNVRTRKPVPQVVSAVGVGNFGADTVFMGGNQYPMAHMNFYVASDTNGSLLKLGGR